MAFVAGHGDGIGESALGLRFNGAGLVCEHWGVADMLSLMQQLGVVPGDPPA